MINRDKTVTYKVNPEFEEDVQIFVDRADNYCAILMNKMNAKGLHFNGTGDDEYSVKIIELTELMNSSYLFKNHEDLEKAEKKLNEIRIYISELR